MSLTEWEQIVEVGRAAVFGPETDVVDSAGIERDAALGVCACSVHRRQRSALGTVRSAPRPPGIEHLSGSTHRLMFERRR